MSFVEKLKNDFTHNFAAHFKTWPRSFLAIYTFLGLICAFAAGIDFPLRSNLWLFDLGAALLFWCIAFWGVGVLARGHDADRS
jgi:hypothetical protein